MFALGDSPRLNRKITDLQYPRKRRVYSFQNMDDWLAGPTEFENQQRAAYAAASISISASRSAITSSKAEIAC
jgi:hypothetical protein